MRDRDPESPKVPPSPPVGPGVFFPERRIDGVVRDKHDGSRL